MNNLNLEFEFLTTEELAKFIKVSMNWLRHNRLSKNPIPYKKFGKFVRYEKNEVLKWIKKQSLI